MKPPPPNAPQVGLTARPRGSGHRSSIDVIEEATALLRRLPAGTWLAFYAPSIPFVAMLLYHWSDMSRANDASQRLIPQVLLLGLLYVVMKCGHAVFGDRLLWHLRRDPQPPEPMTAAMWLKLAGTQALIHSTMPLMLALASLAMLPTVWTYSFYRNTSLLACSQLRTKQGTGSLLSRSLKVAHHEPRSNHVILLVLGLVGLLVWFNTAMLSMMLPQLATTLSGIELAMNNNPWAMLNTTLLITSVASAWLIMSPLFQAACAVRCFEADSVKSGEDVLAGLRWLRGTTVTAVIALGFLMMSPTALASGPVPADPQRTEQLDRAIEQTLDQEEFRWRLPRERIPDDQMGWLERMVRDLSEWVSSTIGSIMNWIGEIIRWLIQSDEDEAPGKPQDGGNWLSNPRNLRLMVIGLLVVLGGGIIFMLIRHLSRRRKAAAVEPVPISPQVDLHDESIIATDLPEDEWLRLANEQLAAGNLRLAIRALFLGTLSRLGNLELLAITPGKTNGMYQRELQRRPRATPVLRDAFERSTRIFERCWYGSHEATLEQLAEVRSQHELISHDPQPPQT